MSCFAIIVENHLNDLIDSMEREMKSIAPSDLNLDERCGSLFISNDGENIITVNRKNLDYFGGFEYVDPSCITVIGEHVIYSSDDDRVAEHLDFYNEKSN